MMRQHAELLERRTGQGVPEWRARKGRVNLGLRTEPPPAPRNRA